MVPYSAVTVTLAVVLSSSPTKVLPQTLSVGAGTKWVATVMAELGWLVFGKTVVRALALGTFTT